MQGRVDVCFATVQPIDSGREDDPPLKEGEELIVAPSLRVSWLTEELRKEIRRACQPRRYNVVRSTEPRLTYGIVRENAPSSWDHDNVIARLLALSRIIHPSSLGLDVIASLGFDENGVLESIFALEPTHAWKPPSQRHWLTKKDWEGIAALFQAHETLPVVHPWSLVEPNPTRRLPLRVHRALWNLSYAAYVYPFHIRWMIVATALEGLIQTGDNATQTFLQRTLALASEVGVPFTKKQAKRLYKLRSTVAHRGWLPGTTDVELDEAYVPMDRIVAGAIRKAILDDGFRAVFDSDAAIMARWPVTLPSEGT